MKGLRLVTLFLGIFLIPSTGYSQAEEQPPLEMQKSTFVYKQVGEVNIEAILYQLRKSENPTPVIIWIHPGALLFGSKDNLPEEQMKFYLSKGFSVVSIDHRLAPAASVEEILTDVIDAVTWIRTEGEDLLKVDPERIYMIGHSAGAYLALLAANTMEEPPQAVISFYGYGDILDDWAHTPDAHYSQMETVNAEEVESSLDTSTRTSASVEERFSYYIYTRQNGLWASTVSQLNRKEHTNELTSLSPSLDMRKNFPPTLLIHGDKDTDVPFSESQKLLKTLSQNKTPHQLIEMKGYGHVFDIFEGGLANVEIAEVFDQIDTFLNMYP
ncbi:MAG: alpha/beta hydrolase [Bacteroidota bacterium]